MTWSSTRLPEIVLDRDLDVRAVGTRRIDSTTGARCERCGVPRSEAMTAAWISAIGRSMPRRR